MLRRKLQIVQEYLRGGPIVDYLLVSVALALGVSHFVTDGCVISAVIAKAFITILILGLWGMMAYTFMQSPFHTGKCIFAASITFVAQANLTMAITMDMKGFTINLEILAIMLFLSCIVAGSMAEVKHLMDVHHGKPKSS